MQGITFYTEIVMDLIKTGIFSGILFLVAYVCDKTILKKINTKQELKKGNTAIAIVYGLLFVAIAILLSGRV